MLLTYFVVQSFKRTAKGALAASVAVQADSEDHAIRMAERLSMSTDGAIAFSRAGDPCTGEFQDAVILFSAGAVPIFDADLAVAC
ncbi:hypothetical protein FJ872_19585 [Mesorhizobium sp. B2-5-9]|uniref:hypothetical protein n=1 Tax=Mesorhizobium sp. B2-5-9 TaxID=2589921 RepID=UPI001126C336|nr:hypothetical protein [Mesorhizobium sp. B2-5-9]TPK15199.1 hypothetical protein FJ872_19585 [Mesorhizobium sp. B2-5-9]